MPGFFGRSSRNDHTPRCGVVDLRDRIAFVIDAGITAFNFCVKRDRARSKRMLYFRDAAEDVPLARLLIHHDGQIIEAENDILAGHDDRAAVCRM